MNSNEEKRQANAEYWRQRAEKTKDISMQKADKFIAHMEREYKAASRNIELEVTDFLSRFAENEQMTLSNARKRLNANELKEFRMELEEYIRKGEENSISADWTKQLESASLLHRIDRLQALKMQIDNQIEALAAYKEQGLNKTLGEIFEENYYRNIFDVQHMMGEGTAFAILDDRRIMQAISKPWRYDGKTFSDSIWENKEKLKYSLERTLTQGIIRGSAPRKIAEAIAKETGRELYAAKRLVLTESAKMAEKASEEGYRELGVKEIEIVVALDERTCEVCGEMDGKHFPLDKAEGLTPPFHPNCRCTTVPYFNDEFTQGEERAAKGEDGKTYYVPADMTYKEWREKYVEEASKQLTLSSGKIGDTDGYSTIESIEDFDYNDTKAKDYVFSYFAKAYRKADVEYACVITPENKIYEVKGIGSTVGINLVGDNLKGAYVIHNHPDTDDFLGDCFSRDDFKCFFKYGIKEMQVSSGLGRYSMQYEGEYFTGEDAAMLYDKAHKKMYEKAFQSNDYVEYEQLETMKVLSDMLEDLVFKRLG